MRPPREQLWPTDCLQICGAIAIAVIVKKFLWEYDLFTLQFWVGTAALALLE